MIPQVLVFGLFFVVAVAQSSSNSTPPIVDLGYGLYQATTNAKGGYYNFSNIRYAQPPVGDLRFAAPVPPLTNRSTVNDGQTGGSCYQANPAWIQTETEFLTQYLTGQNVSNYTSLPANGSYPVPNGGGKLPPVDPQSSEDCLFLDVIVPQNVFNPNCSSGGVAVMVWIYGGGYTTGQKSSYNPIGLLKQSENTTIGPGEGVIFVALNYRLGAFGFLSGPTFQINGTANAGLLDQRLALDWVQSNIHLFGGDPNRVTVFGESAGGGSILHQLTAYGGLNGPAPFAQIIPQSPAFTPLGSNYVQEEIYQQFLAAANATNLTQLRSLPTLELVAANALTVAASPYGQYTYGPAVDGIFAPALPGELLLHGQFDHNVTIMVGHNADEGLIFADPAFQTPSAFNTDLSTFFASAAPPVLSYIENTLYPPSFNGSFGYKDQISRTALLLGDIGIVCNTLYLLDAFAAIAPSYAYLFAAPPALHGQDVAYTYYAAPGQLDSIGFPVNATIAVTLQDYLVNFAQTGTPLGGKEGVLPFFGPYGNTSQIEQLGAQGIEAVVDVSSKQRCAWWQLGLYY
ncbi:MAG: hypothetical protein M1824_002650 [Vezdaea acicularis]|nr:MAG: hypothetical protein M1824_002650 [Vezdaea acicularis]